MKMRIVVIATWLLCNAIACLSIDQFSTVLKTVVDNAPSQNQIVWFSGPNGLCGHSEAWTNMILWPCVDTGAQQFTFETDGTIRSNGKCVTASAFTEGSKLLLATCANPSKDAITWLYQSDQRRILHPSSGLLVTAISGAQATRLTLEKNIFSSFQTWHVDTKLPPWNLAYIIGMNGLCLQISSDNTVFLGTCGTSGPNRQRWLIYPDGTIRPEQNSRRCINFNNLTDRRVIVTSCGLGPTSERWVLTDRGALLNERTNLVMDVTASNPSLREILVFRPTSQPNQQWRIFYQ